MTNSKRNGGSGNSKRHGESVDPRFGTLNCDRITSTYYLSSEKERSPVLDPGHLIEVWARGGSTTTLDSRRRPLKEKTGGRGVEGGSTVRIAGFYYNGRNGRTARRTRRRSGAAGFPEKLAARGGLMREQPSLCFTYHNVHIHLAIYG